MCGGFPSQRPFRAVLAKHKEKSPALSHFLTTFAHLSLIFFFFSLETVGSHRKRHRVLSSMVTKVLSQGGKTCMYQFYIEEESKKTINK